jgi:hypothetical protein
MQELHTSITDFLHAREFIEWFLTSKSSSERERILSWILSGINEQFAQSRKRFHNVINTST